jgi:hypothetical protein
MKRPTISALALALAITTLLYASCNNNILVQTLESCALSDAPTATPGETTAVIAFDTSLTSRCQVEYGTTSGGYDNASVIESSSSKSHSITLSGLRASTAYFYRVRMVDASGVETLSDAYTVTTSADSGAAALLNAPAASPGETSCALTFSTSIDARVSV